MSHEPVLLSRVPDWAAEQVARFFTMTQERPARPDVPHLLPRKTPGPRADLHLGEAEGLSRTTLAMAAQRMSCSHCDRLIRPSEVRHEARFEAGDPPILFTIGLCSDCWTLEASASDGPKS